MSAEHHYRVRSVWTGDRGAGTSDYRAYDRSVTVHIDGKPALEGSSDRAFHGDPAKWNPEDLLLASLSQCHLLSYLHACVRAGVIVTAYRDEAAGTMVVDGSGAGAFREVVLRPRVEVADAAMVDAATRAHAQANAWCFIANSVNFPVRHEPVVTVSGARAGGSA